MKRKKRRLKKKRITFLFVFLLLIVLFAYYGSNLKVNRIEIIGTHYIPDATIIEGLEIKEYPYYKDISINQLKEKLNKIPLVVNSNVSLNLWGTLKITVNEDIPLFYYQNALVTSSKNKIDDPIFFKESLPTLVDTVEEDVFNSLVENLVKVNTNILEMMSEIKYTPSISKNGDVIDEMRFTITMNDGNIAVVDSMNMEKVNYYLDAVNAKLQSSSTIKKGQFNFDSATDSIIFTEKDEEASSDGENELPQTDEGNTGETNE